MFALLCRMHVKLQAFDTDPKTHLSGFTGRLPTLLVCCDCVCSACESLRTSNIMFVSCKSSPACAQVHRPPSTPTPVPPSSMMHGETLPTQRASGRM